MKLKTITLAVMATAVATLAHAQNGTVGVNDNGVPSDNSPTDASLATTFTVADLQSGGNLQGVFLGNAQMINGGLGQDYGSHEFGFSSPAGLSFGNTIFGQFTCTSIIKQGSSPLSGGTSGIDILGFGTYSSGTWDGHAIVNESASIGLSFVQNTIGIEDSGVFSIPAVPEPGTLAMLGMGGSALCVYLRRRKA